MLKILRSIGVAAVVISSLSLAACQTGPGQTPPDVSSPEAGAKALQALEAGFTVFLLSADDATRQPGMTAKDAKGWRDKLDDAYSLVRKARIAFFVRQQVQPINDPDLVTALAKAATENDAVATDVRAKLDALATAAPK